MWPILNNILCVGDRCPEEIPDLLFQLLDLLVLQPLFVPGRLRSAFSTPNKNCTN